MQRTVPNRRPTRFYDSLLLRPASRHEERRARKVKPMIRNHLVLSYAVFGCSASLGSLACEAPTRDGRGDVVTTAHLPNTLMSECTVDAQTSEFTWNI